CNAKSPRKCGGCNRFVTIPKGRKTDRDLRPSFRDCDIDRNDPIGEAIEHSVVPCLLPGQPATLTFSHALVGDIADSLFENDYPAPHLGDCYHTHSDQPGELSEPMINVG